MDQTTTPDAPDAPSKKVQARVLSPTNGYAIGELGEFDAATAKSLAASGVIDPHKDAVAYAKTQKAKADAAAKLAAAEAE